MCTWRHTHLNTDRHTEKYKKKDTHTDVIFSAQTSPHTQSWEFIPKSNARKGIGGDQSREAELLRIFFWLLKLVGCVEVYSWKKWV